MFLESVKWHDLECSLMGGCEDHIGGGAVLVRLQPVGCGHTPPIAGRESRESKLRHRRHQVVADLPLVLEKLSGDHCADRVAAHILGTCVAAPITKEAGDRVHATRGKRSAQDIELCHGPSIAPATAAV